MSKETLGHDYDLCISLNDDVVAVDRSVFFGEKGNGEDDGGFDCAGTVGTFGTAGGCFGTAGTFGCCC